ncbi:MAG TPA: GTP-binding protein [Stellaceae bacterium]|nr:GTP-binding protein [Stellaceae bacterium]
MKWTSEATSAALFAGADQPLFGRRERRPRGARLPVVVVTGFLGSGKTTLIRALLDRPEGADTALVVNEFGEIGIDQALLRASSDATVLIGNGCLCCNVRSDLEETLRGLFIDRARGAVPSFARVVIETSGLADPAPILQTFATDRALGGEFHLQAMVAVVDALNGAVNLERMEEARCQVAVADRIVLSKSDLARRGAVEDLAASLRALSAAPLREAALGAVEPQFLLDDGIIVRPELPEGSHRHTHGIESFALLFEKPMPWPAFAQAMGVLTNLRGADLLRAKGLVAIEGAKGPVVVHYVQHVAHNPVELLEWPDEDRRSRLVFVTRGIPREAVAALFAAIGGVAAPPPP